MNVTIITPLYPPDIAPPAPYVKELAARLSTHHSVSVIAYGSYPEEVPGVRIRTVSKRQPRIMRMIALTALLFKELPSAEVIIVENGPSIELPVGIVARILRKRVVVHIGDSGAYERTSTSFVAGRAYSFLTSYASAVLTTSPCVRPEILPFEPEPISSLADFESSWEVHLRALEKTFA